MGIEWDRTKNIAWTSLEWWKSYRLDVTKKVGSGGPWSGAYLELVALKIACYWFRLAHFAEDLYPVFLQPPKMG